MMKKIILSLVLLVVSAGFLLNALYPYYKSFLMEGQIKSIEYNSATKEAECIMVNEKTGKIVEFTATGKRWKIVEVNDCIQVKMYPSIVPTKTGAFKIVNLEKLLNCPTDDNNAETKKQLDPATQKDQNLKDQNDDNYTEPNFQDSESIKI